MFELPELIILARQINRSLTGKVIRSGRLGNAPHKFVWYNRTPEAFAKLTRKKTIGEAWAKGKWLFIPLEPGYMLSFGECGGKVLHHAAGSQVPKKYHLYLVFEDESFFTVTTQMWGAIELYRKGEEEERQGVQGMRVTPIELAFTFGYFGGLLENAGTEKKRSAKSLLTQDQLIPGLGNAIAQDILFKANLHPRHPIGDLTAAQRRALFDAILVTVNEIIEAGGRYDEYDLDNQPGGYVRIMDRNAVGRPCPECGTVIEKVRYLGGACYLCPACQRLN